MRTLFLLLILLIGSEVTCFAQSFYRVSLWRAAPGSLLELIEALKDRAGAIEDDGGIRPIIIRHSQGDHWDLMTIEFMESLTNYYSSENISLNPAYDDPLYDILSFNEDLFVQGASMEDVRSVFGSNGFFHVEMFRSLPGKRKELVREREMENQYLKKLGRPENLIFTKISGANWDVLTIGGYRDIQHFAESSNIPEDVEEKAAIEAGFEGVRFISPYLRSLIASHNDTLANKVQQDD